MTFISPLLLLQQRFRRDLPVGWKFSVHIKMIISESGSLFHPFSDLHVLYVFLPHSFSALIQLHRAQVVPSDPFLLSLPWEPFLTRRKPPNRSRYSFYLNIDTNLTKLPITMVLREKVLSIQRGKFATDIK